jgi:hypothetical protein
VNETQPPSRYRRRSGVTRKPGQLGSRGGYTIDGGEDAPLSDHGKAMFRYWLLGIFAVFVLLVLLTASGH